MASQPGIDAPNPFLLESRGLEEAFEGSGEDQGQRSEDGDQRSEGSGSDAASPHQAEESGKREEESTERKPGEKPPSRRMLQEELDAARAEIQRLTDDGKQWTEKHAAAEARATRLTEELAERDRRYASEQAPEYDWRKDREVAPLRQEIVSLVQQSAAELEDESAARLFRDEFPHMLQGYAQHLAAGHLKPFREKLAESFGDDADRVLAALKAALPKHRLALEREQAGRTKWQETRQREFDDRRREASDSLSRLGHWSDDEIKSDPDHEDAIISQIAKANPKVAQEIDAMIERAIPLQAGLPPLPPDATPDQIRQHRAAAHYLEGLRASAPANALKVRVLTAALKSSYAELAKLRHRVSDAARANKPEAGYVEGAKPTTGAATTTVPQGQDYETAKNPFLR